MGHYIYSFLHFLSLSYSSEAAFFHTYDFDAEKRIGIIRAHNMLSEALMATALRRSKKGYMV